MKRDTCLEQELTSLVKKAAHLHQSGQLDQAEILYKKILSTYPERKDVNNPATEVYHLVSTDLGNVLVKQGKLAQATNFYQKAVEFKPNFAEAHNNIAEALQQQGRFNEAFEACQQAIKYKPDFALAHHNLAHILRKQGKLGSAVQAYKKALELDPNFFSAYNNLGNIFKEQGKWAEAFALYKKALSINPNLAEIHNNIGNVLRKQGKLEAAVEYFNQAIKINPQLIGAYNNLASTQKKQGKLEDAVHTYQKILELYPDCAKAEFGVCMTQLPIIYKSTEEVNLRRSNYQKHLEKLAHRYQKASVPQRAKAAEAVGVLQPFYLAYQGLNDRDLQKTYGELICQLMSARFPQYSQVLPLPQKSTQAKIKIGFVSGYFSHHSVWKIPLKGWIENLDKNKFEIFAYYTDTKQDQETLKAKEICDQFIQAPLLLEDWCEQIRQDNLDVLIFPEFGMEPITVRLGCLRLAPIQIVFGGHPETSGMPTIDYHLSSDLMEPENAQDHYTEKLVRLPNLAINYTLLERQPPAITKAHIGIKESEIMFWCCQSLFKYLPSHDDIFPRIAKELGNCKFVFIKYGKDDKEMVTQIFNQRLEKAFANWGLDYQDYCLGLKPMKPNIFAGVTAAADIFLDSIGWSGNNTIMESTAYNLPIVTFPGELMRGRHAIAILKMMGIEETIASSKEEYIKIAVRLGRDKQYRQEISQKIARNKHKLYNDMEPIKALEDFLINLVHK